MGEISTCKDSKKSEIIVVKVVKDVIQSCNKQFFVRSESLAFKILQKKCENYGKILIVEKLHKSHI